MGFKEDFIRNLLKAWKVAVQELPPGAKRVPFDWIWPQAALESNWGRSGPTMDCNNLFGMKGSHFGQGLCTKHKPPKDEGPRSYTYFDSWKDCLVGYMRKVTHKGNRFYPCYQAGLRSGAQAYWHCLDTNGWDGDGEGYAKKVLAVSRSVQEVKLLDGYRPIK